CGLAHQVAEAESSVDGCLCEIERRERSAEPLLEALEVQRAAQLLRAFARPRMFPDLVHVVAGLRALDAREVAPFDLDLGLRIAGPVAPPALLADAPRHRSLIR